MAVDYDVIPEILLYTLGFFTVYFLLYKQFIYSILDQIFIYIFTLSFSSVLVVNVLIDKPTYICHFFLCHAFFYVGFSSTVRLLQKYRSKEFTVYASTDFFDYEIFRKTVYILFGLYFLANTVLFYTTGFALLSSDPTVAKVENFAQGFGIIMLINIGVGSFVITSVLFLILSDGRWIDYFLLFIAIILTALEGSKSGLVRVLISLALLIYHQLFRQKKNILNKAKFAISFGLLAVLGVAFTVLVKENVDTDQTLFAFLRRFLYGADSVLYFYLPVNEQYFDHFRFWQYPAYFFDQILGFLRIVTPKEALGNVMVMNAFPTLTGTIVGPNTAYYIEGQIFFGYYGAFIYSLLVGAAYSLIRHYYFHARYYTAFWFVLICCICQQASALMVEVTFFVSQVFYMLFFVVPVYLFVNLIIYGKIKFNKFHY